MSEIELDPADVRVGNAPMSMERRALALIGRVRLTGINPYAKPPQYGQPSVCEHTVLPLPEGCWNNAGRSPYAAYGADRWCDACIAYSALNGTLPKPQQTINVSGDGRVQIG